MLYQCVDEKVGIIKEVLEWLPEPDDPKIYVAGALSANTALFNQKNGNSIFSSGAGFTRDQAIFSAIGEGVERYCGAIYDKSKLTFATYLELERAGASVVHPEQFQLYHREQYQNATFPFLPFTTERRLRWVEGVNWKSGQSVYLPAQLVYLPYFEMDEDLVWFSISTGMSCAASFEEAVLKGIYEVIERDAFSIHWFNRLERPVIDLSSHPRIAELYQTTFKIANLHYYLMDYTLDLPVHTVFGMLVDPRGGTLVAASARTRYEDAVTKTLLELAQGRVSWKRDFVQGIDRTFADDYSDFKDFQDHVEFYTKRERCELIQFAYGCTDRVMIPHEEACSIKEDLTMVVQHLEARGYSLYVVDLTTPDIAELGLHVVRVIIPGMTEITNDHCRPRAGSQRIYDLPVELGLREQPITFATLNPVPHPFP
ncbi:YcaO-like family protein [Rubeoparvulum massiliense]|uniref:YcaO-like family protein n=1 Tax=Rubeoparvulum massiliense TaxID=1631346 RepID=UPI00065E7466|nr:YcaO-like family protein [Rubeoparvulum massiliense]